MSKRDSVDVLLQRYYREQPRAWSFLEPHLHQVAQAAVALGEPLGLDTDVLWEMGMVHDIGVFQTYAPGIGCFGEKHYLWHGTLGRSLLEKEKWFAHALVAERHTGVGLTAREVQDLDLGLPQRDMLPISMEEQLICFVDNFYSKSCPRQRRLTEVQAALSRFGESKVRRLLVWWEKFDGRSYFDA